MFGANRNRNTHHALVRSRPSIVRRMLSETSLPDRSVCVCFLSCIVYVSSGSSLSCFLSPLVSILSGSCVIRFLSYRVSILSVSCLVCSRFRSCLVPVRLVLILSGSCLVLFLYCTFPVWCVFCLIRFLAYLAPHLPVSCLVYLLSRLCPDLSVSCLNWALSCLVRLIPDSESNSQRLTLGYTFYRVGILSFAGFLSI